jgi:hypothetical protein
MQMKFWFIYIYNKFHLHLSLLTFSSQVNEYICGILNTFVSFVRPPLFGLLKTFNTLQVTKCVLLLHTEYLICEVQKVEVRILLMLINAHAVL